MVSRIRRLSDVVGSGLCCGCGACTAYCTNAAVQLVNDEDVGIYPIFSKSGCGDCKECLAFCPGSALQYRALRQVKGIRYAPLIGPYLEIYEGHAVDPDIRYHGSSGGALSALALYCLEKESMEAVLHTGMHTSRPWLNKSVRSKDREELLKSAGSRYAPSSPCDILHMVEESERPCVFIGKPCDAAAVFAMRRAKKRFDDHLGLSLSFFCAGPPVTRATLDLISNEGIDPNDVTSIRYRGNGWPGEFEIRYRGDTARKAYTYHHSWGKLAKYRRPFRCSICPDGTGEFADIAGGDAWHIYKDNGDPGQSVVIVRTTRGREIIEKAIAAGYLSVVQSTAERILAGQGLHKRKKELYGRLLAMRMTAIPLPDYDDFPIAALWQDIPVRTKIKTILGTIKRILIRHYLFNLRRLLRQGNNNATHTSA